MSMDVHVFTPLFAIPLVVFYGYEKRSASPRQMQHRWQPRSSQQTNYGDLYIPVQI